MTPWDFYRLRVQVLKLHQADIAVQLGKSVRAVGRYENAEAEIPFLVAQRMLDLATEKQREEAQVKAARRSRTGRSSPSSEGPAPAGKR